MRSCSDTDIDLGTVTCSFADSSHVYFWPCALRAMKVSAPTAFLSSGCPSNNDTQKVSAIIFRERLEIKCSKVTKWFNWQKLTIRGIFVL